VLLGFVLAAAPVLTPTTNESEGPRPLQEFYKKYVFLNIIG